ncbi:LPS export ABC transporter permease LptG [Marinomonas ostreistagni]|uniref:LPS export ABC transporter permease LptG n=1 Tax=Marinomonas ostreistagni TaxID=359209 RepID=UPI001950A313|nr:LPS export ABC transporter permease LptG [Marinomonas ostreistagni]MBM6552221.1 LPS export ABC transporter permease LptG [Marinomonas ostreistagni]
MRKLDRYVGTSVLLAVCLVTFVLLGLDFAITFIEEVKRINEQYTAGVLMQVLALKIPGKLAEYLPVASLIGTLIGLGALASTSEITVMRAAGIPLWRLGYAACKPILLLALVGLIVAEFVSPIAEQKANLVDKIQHGSGQSFAISGGSWLKTNGDYVYIDAADTDGNLYRMTIYDREGDQLHAIITAQRATQIADNRWQLHDIETTTFTPDQVIVEQADTVEWRSSLRSDYLYLSTQEPDSLSLTQLYQYQSFLNSQGLNADNYELSFWNKALRPLSSLALVIVAISTIFGPLRSSTMGARIFSGVLIGLTFQNTLYMTGRFSLVSSLPPLVGILVPILVCFGIGLYLLKRRH